MTEINTLRNMVASGNLEPDSFGLERGMPEWQKASIQSELSGIFPPKI